MVYILIASPCPRIHGLRYRRYLFSASTQDQAVGSMLTKKGALLWVWSEKNLQTWLSTLELSLRNNCSCKEKYAFLIQGNTALSPVCLIPVSSSLMWDSASIQTKLLWLYFIFTSLFPGSKKEPLELSSTILPPFILSLQSSTLLGALNLISRCCRLLTALQRVENRDPVILGKAIFVVHRGDRGLGVSEDTFKSDRQSNYWWSWITLLLECY